MAQADVTLVRDGKAQSAIYVAPEVMAPDIKLPAGATQLETQKENDRRRLRESVNDMALYIQKMSGASVEIVTVSRGTGSPAIKNGHVPIWIGQLAQARYGPVKRQEPYQQGFRVVVSNSSAYRDQGIGLIGESDESTSYAIYEVLDRLGCRWYMPGELGEVIPQRKTITLSEVDISDVPDTLYRSLTYADDAFKRRTRRGGVYIHAVHALEHYITKEQREQHPEWRGVFEGEPHRVRLKWSNPEVADAIANAIIARLDKQYTHTVSLSPDDGSSFDQTDDRAWDAGDFDPSLGEVSITDRYIKLCNIIAEKVTKKYPDVLFGFLAYVNYTRPPVREKLHPNLVPQIAPITYCRAHAMTDTHICPSRPQLRPIVEGWAKAAPRVSYYNYMFHLAETTVPYPMIHQMSEELPIIYRNNVKFWQPETMPNFESVLPGMVLTIRKSWDTEANSQAVLDEFFTRFYGAAQKPMRRYWHRFDNAWTNHPQHSGSHLSYLARFTPQMLQAARADIKAAQAAAKTATERQRVELQADAFGQFELYMKMLRDLAAGRLANLGEDANRWTERQLALGEQYAENFAFTKAQWTPNIGAHYFKVFLGATYQDAGRIARDFNIIAPPLSHWHYMVDKDDKGEELGWNKPAFEDKNWKVTNLGGDTWSTLGIDNYMGTVWYRHNVQTGDLPANKKTFLWLSSSDGKIKVFVNGQHIPFVNAKGETLPEFFDHSQPASFDITSALKPNAPNQIAIRADRSFVNELGSGGLLSPVYLYQEK